MIGHARDDAMTGTAIQVRRMPRRGVMGSHRVVMLFRFDGRR
jgi:hypothetical protein